MNIDKHAICYMDLIKLSTFLAPRVLLLFLFFVAVVSFCRKGERALMYEGQIWRQEDREFKVSYIILWFYRV